MGENEIHALLGANGSGKTTLARVVMGCAGYAAAAGRVRFRGRDLAGMPIHERARLGIVLLITHVEPVARIAGRASCLCGGRIVFSGDPAAAAERYRRRRCVICDGVTCTT